MGIWDMHTSPLSSGFCSIKTGTKHKEKVKITFQFNLNEPGIYWTIPLKPKTNKAFGNHLSHHLLHLPGFWPQEHDGFIFFASYLINVPLEEQWQWQQGPPLTLTEFQ